MPKAKYRATIIDLNGAVEQTGLFILTASLPIWLFFLPQFFVSGGPIEYISLVFVICTMWLGSFFSLQNNRLVFQKDKLVIAGIMPKFYLFKEIKRVRCDNENNLVFLTNDGSQESSHIVSLSGLSRENATILWTLLATRLRNAQIDYAVRATLTDWAGDVRKPLPLPASTEIAIEDNKPDDLHLLLSLNKHSQIRRFLGYLASYYSSTREVWINFWFLIAGALLLTFAAVKIIPSFSVDSFLTAISTFFAVHFAFASPFLSELILAFNNIFMAAAYLCTLTASLFFAIKHISQPDSIYVDSMGITAQLKTPTGTIPMTHLSWQSISSITFDTGGQSAAKSKNATIYINSNSERLPIAVPLRALAAEKHREIFLEALHSWGRKIVISPALLETLAFKHESSYTDIWLSSLESAPHLAQLTPLNEKDKLEHHSLEIEKLLASGGQGVTYIARWADKEGSPRVVLKEMILPVYIEKAAVKARERFERDALLLKSLEHEQIVKLHDYFVEGHRAFLMLEYCAGDTLRSRVEVQGVFSEEECLKLVNQMLNILEYLHGRTPPVVHRDFTPDNLLIDEEQKIKLIDFDVALEADDSRSKATIVGKQNFLPPEQFRGYPGPQSDIYALGATVHYLVTGLEPQAISSNHPRRLKNNLTEQFDRFVARATEPDAQRRFRNIEDMKLIWRSGLTRLT